MKTSNLLSGGIAVGLLFFAGNSRAAEGGTAPESGANHSTAVLVGSDEAKASNGGAPTILSYETREILKMQEHGVDKNVIRSYIETSSASSQPTSEEIIYLHQRGIPDDLTAAMIQHNARIRAQTPISAVNHGMTENHSMPVAQNSTPVAQAPVVVQAEPSPSVQSPVYVYPQYSGYSYPVYYPSVSFGYYGGYYPYYGSCYRGGYYYGRYCGNGYYYGNHGWAGNHGGGYSVSGGHSGGSGYSMTSGRSGGGYSMGGGRSMGGGGGGYSMAGGRSGGGGGGRSMGGGGGGHR